MAIIPNQRSAFDLPADAAYLNCAFMSPLSHRCVEAGIAAVRGKAHPWDTTAPDFFSLPARGRQLFAQIVNADADGVAVVAATSYAMATACRNLPVAPGQEIVILKDQFPSNVYPWMRLAKDTGATLRMLSVPADGANWTDAILGAIGPNTAVVSTPNCHWTNGALIDVKAVADACRANGAGFVLDLTQSAGALPIDLADIQPDFACASAYKFLMGPYGMGFMWVHPRWREGVPLEENWMSRKGAEDFARLVDYQEEYGPGAQRFEVGERSHFQLMPIAIAAMEQLLEWGIENVQETITARTVQIAERTRQLGFHALEPGARAGHYLGLMREAPLPNDLVQRLAARKVYVSVRGSSIRITPHVYTTDEDIDHLIEALNDEVRID